MYLVLVLDWAPVALLRSFLHIIPLSDCPPESAEISLLVMIHEIHIQWFISCWCGTDNVTDSGITLKVKGKDGDTAQTHAACESMTYAHYRTLVRPVAEATVQTRHHDASATETRFNYDYDYPIRLHRHPNTI